MGTEALDIIEIFEIIFWEGWFKALRLQTPFVQDMRDLEMSLMKKSDVTILTSPVEADELLLA